MYLIGHFRHKFLEVAQVGLAHLLDLDELAFPLGEVALEGVDSLSRLHELRPQVCVFLKELLVEALLLLVRPLIIG